jgi:hypothetical protein
MNAQLLQIFGWCLKNAHEVNHMMDAALCLKKKEVFNYLTRG